ncbi:replication protein P [Rouxiella sp. WC2420]|uniref:Replication protein P n=1 Tax=Rouxiella sp. WC2420 TaxID=3234145 RepID=A0AB39VMF9_9GAMM
MSNRLLKVIEQRDSTLLAKMAPPDNTPAKVVNLEAERMVDSLFRQLMKVFPAAAQTTLKTDADLSAAKKQWIAAFAENDIRTREQLSAGMQHARASESPFWPSPGQFIAWCKEGALKAAGLPDENELYVLTMTYARKRGGYVSPEAYPWPSPAVYWMVTTLCDHMRHESWSEAQLRKGCGTELKLMAKRIDAGETIPQPRARIAQMSVKSALSKSDNLKKLHEICAKHGLRTKP